MTVIRKINRWHPLAAFLLLALALFGVAPAQANSTDVEARHEDAWFSYRDTYQSLIRFEKYGNPKQLIQSHLQVVVKDNDLTLDNLQLTLDGNTMHLVLSLDPTGRAVFPLMKAAYDENAELHVNVAPSKVAIRQRLSILQRADGIYQIPDLRSACDQLLQYMRYANRISFGTKRCLGVQFSYPKRTEAVMVQFKAPGHSATSLPVIEGGAFWGDEPAGYQIVVYRFSDLPATGQIVTVGAPLAISGIIQ